MCWQYARLAFVGCWILLRIVTILSDLEAVELIYTFLFHVLYCISTFWFWFEDIFTVCALDMADRCTRDNDPRAAVHWICFRSFVKSHQNTFRRLIYFMECSLCCCVWCSQFHWLLWKLTVGVVWLKESITYLVLPPCDKHLSGWLIVVIHKYRYGNWNL